MEEVTYQNKFTKIIFYSNGTFEGTIHGKKIDAVPDKKGYLIIPINMFHGRLHRIFYQLFHPEHELLPTEDVHHINGIKTDNSLLNLQLLPHNEHAKITNAENKDRKKKQKWYNNGKNEIQIFPDDIIPDGYYSGRLKTSTMKFKPKISRKNKKFWYNDGTKLARFDTNEEAISQGYIYKGQKLGKNKL